MIKKTFKHSCLLLFILCLATTSFKATAQTQPSVQFSFSTTPVNDSLQMLTVSATIPKGWQLFPVKKTSADDAFVSSLSLDTAFSKLMYSKDTATEVGTLQLMKQPDGSNYRLYSEGVKFLFPLHIHSDSAITLKGSFVWLAKNGDELPAGEEKFSVTINPSKASLAPMDKKKKMEMSLINTFIIALLAGLAAVFTPCVFPLIPVTVSVFLKRSGSHQAGIRNAIIYSLSIIVIYTVPTLLLTWLFGNSILYSISTSAIANLLFFVIFILLSISLFGAFELTLPNSWANKADEKSGTGGLMGIFFMALTLAIVSFSCTGPLVGLLIGQTSSLG